MSKKGIQILVCTFGSSYLSSGTLVSRYRISGGIQCMYEYSSARLRPVVTLGTNVQINVSDNASDDSKPHHITKY